MSSRRETAQVDLARQEAATPQLTLQRNKLIQAYYANAMPLDLFASEQDRINKEGNRIELQLTTSRQHFVDIEDTLDLSLDLLKSGHRSYTLAPKPLRRQMNQAFFEKVLIVPDGSVQEVAIAEPFSTLLKFKGEAENQPDKSKNKAENLVLRKLAIPLAASSEDKTLVAGAGFEPATSGL